MSLEENKTIIRKMIEAFNERNLRARVIGSVRALEQSHCFGSQEDSLVLQIECHPE